MKSRAKQLLVKLADAMAIAAGVPRPAIPTLASPCVLWALAADDTLVPPTPEGARGAYAVLRIFGGEPSTHGPARVAIACNADGPTAAETYELLEQLHNALLTPDTDGTPGVARREWAIGSGGNAFVVSIFNLTPPTLLGSDDQGRIDGSFNFEAGYRPA